MAHPQASECTAFCATCPPPETVISLLQGLGFRLTFHMDAVTYPVSSATPDLPAQFHFSDEQGTDVIFLAGKDTPLDGEHFPTHACRFWVSPGADPCAYRRIVQALATRWVLIWQYPRTDQDMQRTA